MDSYNIFRVDVYQQLDQASLGLSREYLNRGLSDKLVQAYYEYMVDIAVLLGADRARAQSELKDSLDFEMKLANVSASIPQDHFITYCIIYEPDIFLEVAKIHQFMPC